MLETESRSLIGLKLSRLKRNQGRKSTSSVALINLKAHKIITRYIKHSNEIPVLTRQNGDKTDEWEEFARGRENPRLG